VSCRLRLSLLFLLLVPAMCAAATCERVRTGIEVLRERQFDVLRGKRVGLITNPTGVDAEFRSTIDILFTAPEVKLVALFAPEHGVRGEYSAGEKVKFVTDPQTKLPVYSLHGETRKPTPEMLHGLDVLVYDLQDIGCRSYTYISTMGISMQAAAEAKIGFVVLDRPNPLGGVRIEGNVVAPGAESFVGQFPIPYVYGLTCGELARLLNNEHMIGPRPCKLTVVPMQGWRREMTFAETGLPWVPTSPHIPRADSSLFYVATGMMGELGVLSEGVGYTLPFEIFAAPWIDSAALCREIDKQKIPGVRFRPITYKPYYSIKPDAKILQGVQIYLMDPAHVDLMSIQYRLLEAHQRLYPDKNPFELAEKSRISMFDKVSGGPKLRELFTQRMKYADVEPFLRKQAEAFRSTAKKYYLY
jgi:uncharacterized protein YbbC (DUF1343 family)